MPYSPPLSLHGLPYVHQDLPFNMAHPPQLSHTPLEGEPASKRPKSEENPEPSPVHHLPPATSENSSTPPPSTSTDSKSRDSAPKKKSAARSKKVADPTAPAPQSALKKPESTVTTSLTPLRADNKAKLEAMGLTWLLPRYQPYPTLHPFKMGWSKPNSSNRIQSHLDLVANPRGYTLGRTTYPTQEGKWYFELLITSAPEVIERLLKPDVSSAPPTTAMQVSEGPAETPTLPSQSPASAPVLMAPIAGDASNTLLGTLTTEADPSSAMDIQPMVPIESLPAEPLPAPLAPLQQAGGPPTFPDIDTSLFMPAVNMLTEMGHVLGPYKVTLPSPRWRLGWATEQADSEAPVGTDVYGFSWRDDGTLFHQARPISLLIAQNHENEAAGESSKALTKPDLELLEDLPTPESEPTIESYTSGDVLGFGIELPSSNMAFIREIHANQEAILVNQSTELQLRREIHAKQAALSYPQANQAQLRSEIEALTAQLAEIKPVSPITLPPSEPGTRMTFYKNGKLQNVAVANFPPGSYYPAVSLYYQAAALANFGPTFAHPPPPGFLPASQLPQYYQIPLPESIHLPQPPP